MLKELMIELDMMLTGKPRLTAEQTARHQPEFSPFGNNNIYYLSDGGYSRVVINDEFRMWVTSTSLDRVKEAWKTLDVLAQVAKIQTLCREIYPM